MEADFIKVDRSLLPLIRQDLPRKIILLSGPRQCGKTTLAKMIDGNHDCVNYDDAEHRAILIDRSWDRQRNLLILDELHKMPKWKAWLKGVFDTEGLSLPIIVTGSARLETYRKVGDSLAGRYFPFRLHPLDMKEVIQILGPTAPPDSMERLLRFSGFPEPFFQGTLRYYNRWRRTHLDIILRQDMLDLEDVQSIVQIETLIELLRRRVGSPVSYSSLARDLCCSDKTIKRWLTLLENMYVLFKVLPMHRNIARAQQKSPKFYFYDTGQIKGDDGLRLENLVACALLKETQFRQDCLGENWQLNYLRTRAGKEVDFALSVGEQARMLVEVKWADAALSRNLSYFVERISGSVGVQLVKDLVREKTYPNGCEVRRAEPWLAAMPISIV